MNSRNIISELTQLSELNYESEDENILLSDKNTNDLKESINKEYYDVETTKLRKATDTQLTEDIYGGIKTTRKRNYSVNDSDSDILMCLNDDYDADKESFDKSVEESIATESEDELDELNSDESEQTHNVASKTIKKEDDAVIDCNIYSVGSKSISTDIRRGFAIRNQFRIWDSILECRIKIQKALSASNDLTAIENSKSVELQMESEIQLKSKKCNNNLLLLLDKMIDCQGELLNQCHEYKNSKELEHCDPDEEILSSESELDHRSEMNKEEQIPKKKMKLSDYSFLIRDKHVKFCPFRNSAIQKWNEKTKVSLGKFANSNFSAFDHSALKQIEQIMTNKSLLLEKTRIRRGDQNTTSQKDGEAKPQESQEAVPDSEIFDDTDFYHKLLRDYIERKSLDSLNSSQTERQLIELQKLRSKIKKNIDTKSTKGRKLRYMVLTKLVNFMAPTSHSTWNEQGETDLYNSLFGRIKEA